MQLAFRPGDLSCAPVNWQPSSGDKKRELNGAAMWVRTLSHFRNAKRNGSRVIELDDDGGSNESSR